MSSLTAPQPLADPIRPRARHPMHAQLALIGGGCLTSLLVSCADPTTTSTADRPPHASAASPVLDGTSAPPWPAPKDVASRVTAAGLDLGPMGTAEHYHPHLRISIDGADVPVAANIGVDPTTGAMSALHTHEPDGTIHIEADRVGDIFTLGQLFTEWGVELTATQIGGIHAAGGRQLVVTSNQTPVPGDPADLRLQPDQRIVIQLPAGGGR
jgi:hypothetical protein